MTAVGAVWRAGATGNAAVTQVVTSVAKTGVMWTTAVELRTAAVNVILLLLLYHKHSLQNIFIYNNWGGFVHMMVN